MFIELFEIHKPLFFLTMFVFVVTFYSLIDTIVNSGEYGNLQVYDRTDILISCNQEAKKFYFSCLEHGGDTCDYNVLRRFNALEVNICKQ